MKWFKHQTQSWNDEKLAFAVAEHGLEIYGFWWRILEIIAAQLSPGKPPECKYPDKVWARFCGITVKKFRYYAGFLHELELINLSPNGKDTCIAIDNLAKYRDEWTQRKDPRPTKTRE